MTILEFIPAAAGAWGHKLWVALTEQDGAALWVWDALRETWFTESGLPGLPVCFAAVGAHLYAAAGTALWDLLGRDGPGVHGGCEGAGGQRGRGEKRDLLDHVCGSNLV